MKIAGIIFFFLCASFGASAQTVYKGYIDKFPIELVAYNLAYDNNIRAIYTYSKYNIPIRIDGKLEKDELKLFEKNEGGTVRASFVFKDFDAAKDKLTGIWTNLETKKDLNISLTKMYNIDVGEQPTWQDRELLQGVSIDNKYFRLLVTSEEEDFYPHVTGIKILDRKTDKLLQQFEVECMLWGGDNIEVDDYNFDGYPDFSIFESSYAGPNTSRLYFLYDPENDTFFESGFAGVSLTFDSKEKLIYEHNQCCAGTEHMNVTYKVEDNRMVLVEQTCIRYNPEKEEFVEVTCE